MENPSGSGIVKERSVCADVWVNFSMTVMACSGDGIVNQVDLTQKRLAICHLDTETYKCISKGENANDLLVYSYNNGACTPERNLYDFLSVIPSCSGCTIL